MSYRVYDKKRKKFVTENIYLTPDGDLVESKKSVFGNKLTFIDNDRFVYQSSIGLKDRDNVEIFIGDCLEAQVADDRIVRGIVTYASELAAYIILCFDVDEYYVIGESICNRIKVIGSVFDK